jgi:hypothetical protein
MKKSDRCEEFWQEIGWFFLFGSFCFLRRSPELGFWDYRLSRRISINHEICEFLHPFPLEFGFVVFVIDSPTYLHGIVGLKPKICSEPPITGPISYRCSITDQSTTR